MDEHLRSQLVDRTRTIKEHIDRSHEHIATKGELPHKKIISEYVAWGWNTEKTFKVNGYVHLLGRIFSFGIDFSDVISELFIVKEIFRVESRPSNTTYGEFMVIYPAEGPYEEFFIDPSADAVPYDLSVLELAVYKTQRYREGTL